MWKSITVITFIFGLLLYLIYKTRHHKNYEKRDVDDEYMSVVIKNFGMTLIVAIFILHNHSWLFKSGFLPSIQKIIFFLVIIDTVDYWTHRIIHRIPALKQIIHVQHHEAFDLIPLDAFYQSNYDYIIYMFYIVFLPLLMGVNISEAMIIYGLALTHSIYIHSEEDFDYPIPGFIHAHFHKYHHQIGRGNYSIFFSTWDDYMHTRIQPPSSSSSKQ